MGHERYIGHFFEPHEEELPGYHLHHAPDRICPFCGHHFIALLAQFLGNFQAHSSRADHKDTRTENIFDPLKVFERSQHMLVLKPGDIRNVLHRSGGPNQHLRPLFLHKSRVNLCIEHD